MFLIVFLILIYSFISSVPVKARDYTYSFILADNSIDLSFSKLFDLPVSSIPTVTENPPEQISSMPILSFVYELKSSQPLMPNLPMLLLVKDEQVLFYLDSSQANLAPKQVFLDLSDFKVDSNNLPIFYRSQTLGDFTFQLSQVEWLTSLPVRRDSVVEIKNLHVMKEQDQSLTILFEISGNLADQNTYQLVCQTDSHQTAHASTLLKTDDFFWSDLVFHNFKPNSKEELIFQLVNFDCHGSVYVKDQFGNRSQVVEIIDIQTL